MSELYVPIDHSNVKDAIPEGEDIIYSTLCKVMRNIYGKNKKYTWISHVLMTPNGFAYTEPNFIQKHMPPQAYYIPWYEIRNIGNRTFFVSLDHQFYLEKNPDEPKTDFKNRGLRFPVKFIPIAIQSIEKRLNVENIEKKEIKKLKGSLERLKKYEVKINKYLDNKGK
ncbi:MAG: hypothetical protein ACFFA0_14095 [Promethearchaeota archaeon]